jgi:hypothetical protein
MVDVAVLVLMDVQSSVNSQIGCWMLLCACVVCFVPAVVYALLAFGFITHTNTEEVC